MGRPLKCPVCAGKTLKQDEPCNTCHANYGRILHLNDPLGIHKGNARIVTSQPTEYTKRKQAAAMKYKNRRDKSGPQIPATMPFKRTEIAPKSILAPVRCLVREEICRQEK